MPSKAALESQTPGTSTPSPPAALISPDSSIKLTSPESGSAAQTCHSVLFTWSNSTWRLRQVGIKSTQDKIQKATCEHKQDKPMETSHKPTCQYVSPGCCFLWLRAKGTSKLCEVGHRSSIFLPSASGLWFLTVFHFAQCPGQPVKMSIATMWALAWPCFPVLEVETSTHLTGDLGRSKKDKHLGAEQV